MFKVSKRKKRERGEEGRLGFGKWAA